MVLCHLGQSGTLHSVLMSSRFYPLFTMTDTCDMCLFCACFVHVNLHPLPRPTTNREKDQPHFQMRPQEKAQHNAQFSMMMLACRAQQPPTACFGGCSHIKAGRGGVKSTSFASLPLAYRLSSTVPSRDQNICTLPLQSHWLQRNTNVIIYWVYSYFLHFCKALWGNIFCC